MSENTNFICGDSYGTYRSCASCPNVPRERDYYGCGSSPAWPRYGPSSDLEARHPQCAPVRQNIGSISTLQDTLPQDWKADMMLAKTPGYPNRTSYGWYVGWDNKDRTRQYNVVTRDSRCGMDVRAPCPPQKPTQRNVLQFKPMPAVNYKSL